MPGLPRKYAKMGFAKGWRAYKSSKKTKITVKSAGSVKKMVRYRRLRKAHRHSSRSSNGGSVMKLALGGAVYGLIREPINQLAKNIPLIGGFGDEVALGVLSYVAATKGSGWVRSIGRAGVVIEAHNLARNMGGNLFSSFLGTTSTVATTTTTNSFK